MALDARRQKFIDEYLLRWNATQAAIEAGYSARSAYSQGSRLLKNDEVQQAIRERMAALTMQADEVLYRLTEHARADMGEFMGKSVPELIAHPMTRLIKEIDHEVREDGSERIKIKLHDAQAALTHLWKHHQLAQGKATDAVDLTDAKERLAQRIARLAPPGAADQPAGDAERG